MSVFSFNPACLFFRLEKPHLAAEDPVSLPMAVAFTAGALNVVPCVSLRAIGERDDVVESPFKRVWVLPVGFFDRLHSTDRTDPSVAVAYREAIHLAVVFHTEMLAAAAELPALAVRPFLPG